MGCSLYITADHVGDLSGGGRVTAQEKLALEEARIGLDGIEVFDAARMKEHAALWSDPIQLDKAYAAAVTVFLETHSVRLVQLYAGCFTETIRVLKKHGARISYTAAAHDVDVSRAEFKKLGLEFTHRHIVNPSLWDWYLTGYREADVVICPSTYSAKIMERFGCRNVRIVPHGVTPTGPTPFPKAFAVGYLGQSGPDKGLLYLFQAWAKLGWTDVRLVLAGNNVGPAAWLWRTHGAGSLEVMGFVRSITDFFRRIHVYVQPSATEGFGIEVLEALAHGRPVIASKNAGASECVEEGVTGYTVPALDADAIADRLRLFRESEKMAASMAQACTRTADLYDWTIIRQRYRDVWIEVLK